MLKILIIYLIVINVITFLMYGIDKLKAKANKWRIKESVLIGMAVIGGCYGAFVGMHLFHHKTKKPKFYLSLPFFTIVYTGLLCYFLLK